MRTIAVSILTFTMMTPTIASASGQIKPGLWEMTTKSDALKNMPKIPPEQMEQMRRMGIEMPQMQDGGMISKVCISKEMAERDQAPAIEQKEMGCESRNYRRSGNSYSADIVCNGKELKGEGRVKGTYASDQSFTSTYDFKGSMHGQPVNQRHETSGKWLGADCGNIRPMSEMLPKK